MLSRQNNIETDRSRFIKTIRYMESFSGKPGTLPSFITTVERILEENKHRADFAFRIIYEKITAEPKNYLQSVKITSQEDCKSRLKLQYKPRKDQSTIIRHINQLQVRSISELDYKISDIVIDNSECAMFSDYQDQVTNNLGSLLEIKVKEIAAI